jgi:predicted  nucleic acid-binding Zn-ribbon protein
MDKAVRNIANVKGEFKTDEDLAREKLVQYAAQEIAEILPDTRYEDLKGEFEILKDRVAALESALSTLESPPVSEEVKAAQPKKAKKVDDSAKNGV